MQVRITDADGKPLPAGETGEIEAKGAAVMLGYWNNPKANAETLKDGWLRTGDVGRLDEDGFLTLSDRSKDVIISGGTNIYPREVEEALLTHADVREVSAIGVPDADWGEIVVACVVLEQGARADDADARRALPHLDRALQAAEALCLSRRAAEEQLRQGAEDRIAQDDGESVGWAKARSSRRAHHGASCQVMVGTPPDASRPAALPTPTIPRAYAHTPRSP